MASTISHKGGYYTGPSARHSNGASAGRLWPALVLWVLFCLTASAQERGYVPGRILVKPRSHLSDAEFTRRIQARGALHRRTLPRTNIRVLAVAEEQTESLLAALKNDPDIEFAERDFIAHACAAPNNPYVVSGSEWHLAKIQALQAWNITNGASNTLIAILDSGINAAHPDLAGRTLPGYDFVNNDTDPVDDFVEEEGFGEIFAAAIGVAEDQAGEGHGCFRLRLPFDHRAGDRVRRAARRAGH